MGEYKELGKENLNIIIESENYTLTKSCVLQIYYDEIIDKIYEEKIKTKYIEIKHESSINSKIPKNSKICCIFLETGALNRYRYYFSFYKSLEEIKIKFTNGQKLPIVSINGKLAYKRENLGICILF